MEVFLEADGITFIDDFAHHPTAVRETIQGTLDRWPGRRLTVVFEPRSNTTATNQFQEDLCHAFRDAHEIWIGPIYRADRIPEEERLDRESLTGTLKHSGIKAHYTDDVEEIVQGMKKVAREGDVVLILSNGAFEGIYEKLVRAFSGKS